MYAQGQTQIASIQNALSMLWYDPTQHDPMLRFCEQNEIAFLAFAPLGGNKNRGLLEQQADIVESASKAGMSAYQFALSFLLGLSPSIIPIPGSIDRNHIIHNLTTSSFAVPTALIDALMAS
jgi:diketogulonate reductase-like aldo/keto reductase